MATFRYDDVNHHYLTGSGRVVTKRDLVTIRDAFTAAQEVKAKELARAYAQSDSFYLDGFRKAFQAMIEETFSANYLLARGGLNAATIDDWRKIEQLIGVQFDFADRFYRTIERDGLSVDQIAARASQYMGSSVQAYEQAMASGFGIDLPAYPADGQTVCLNSCRCSWIIEETDDAYVCTWQTEQDGNVCPDCEANGATWNPLILAKSSANA